MYYSDFNLSILEIVEDFAETNGLISSEEQLSELFDEQIAPSVIEQFGADDEPAMAEAFNNWTDGLCTDHTIHEEQYSAYCYVGEYS